MSQRVLVTGATGFVGCELLDQLVRAGCEVHALARTSSDRSGTPRAVQWHAGDITDADSVSAFCAHAGKDAWLIHGAALISYRRRDAALQWRVNVEGTRNVLLAARRAGVARMCHVSSIVALKTPSSAGSASRCA